MDIQAQANHLAANGQIEEAKNLLLQYFNETHSKYPQYKGFFDNGRLVKMRKNWYKAGQYAFRKDDVALIKDAHPSYKAPIGEVDSWTAFSPSRGWNVVLWQEHFVEF